MEIERGQVNIECIRPAECADGSYTDAEQFALMCSQSLKSAGQRWISPSPVIKKNIYNVFNARVL